MKKALLACLFPVAAFAQDYEQIRSEADARAALAEQQFHWAWSNLHQAAQCVNGTTQSAQCDPAKGRPEQRSAANTSVTQAVILQLLASKNADLKTGEEKLDHLRAEDVFHRLYVATTYGTEIFYRWSPEGVRDSISKVGIGDGHVGRGWRDLDEVVYLATWLLAIEHVETGPIVLQAESELRTIASQAASHQEIASGFENGLRHLGEAALDWPSSAPAELVAATALIEEAKNVALSVESVMTGAQCGANTHPCVMGEFDPQDMPGHAVSWWALSPDRGLSSMPRLLSDAWFNFRLLLSGPGLTAEHDDALYHVGAAIAHVSRAWRHAMKAHLEIAYLVAKEHERH